MAVQLTLTDISSGYQGSDIQANFTAIEDEFDKVLYRDGSLPVTDTIDMNSQRLVNLPAPTSSTEPLRKDDQFTTDEAQQFVTDAETAKDEAETALFNFQDRWLGPSATDPTEDGNGNALEEGDLYFDTVNDVLKSYDGTDWIVSANQYFPFVDSNVFADEVELNLIWGATFTKTQLNDTLSTVESLSMDMGDGTNVIGGATETDAWFERTGNIVVYHQKAFSFSSEVNTYTLQNSIPSQFRPANAGVYNIVYMGEVTAGGSAYAIRVLVNMSGVVQFDFIDPATGTLVDGPGVASFSMTWPA